ncbi:MAG: YafY family protein [Clostridia bacterium]
MRESRLFKLLYLLLSGDTLTAPDLARRLEVSERTIYRDIDRLSAAGIPIHTKQGKGGGVSLLPGFVLDKRLLSQEEQREMLFGLQSLAAAQPEAGALLEKLRAFFPTQRTDWIEVDFTRWGGDEEERRRFALLRDAILQRRIIAFSYRDMYGQLSRRSAMPAKLVFKQSAWYMQAYCLHRSDYRTFKMARISGLCITDEHFQTELIPPPIDWADSGASLTKIPVCLRFAPQAAPRVYDEFEGACIEALPTGELLVRTSMSPDGWLLSYLFTFGETVFVEQPAQLRAQMITKAQKIIQKSSET